MEHLSGKRQLDHSRVPEKMETRKQRGNRAQSGRGGIFFVLGQKKKPLKIMLPPQCWAPKSHNPHGRGLAGQAISGG